MEHPEFKEHMKNGTISKNRCKGFPKTLDPCDDKNGHGTHAASVLLQTAPDIDLYIARVVDDTGNIIKENDYEGVINVRVVLSQSKVRLLTGPSAKKSM
jgi:hypothetical protein